MKHSLATLLMVLSISSARAQTGTISFDDPVEPTNSNYVSYLFNNAGDTETRAYKPFNLTVDHGSGDAANLVGQNFLGFCVNPVFTTPGDGALFNYDTTGDVLSYDLDGIGAGPDYWNVDTYIKFSALKDIFATYVNVLATLDPSSEAAASLNTAIGFAVNEIVMDYDGTAASLNLSLGNSLVLNTDLSQISGSALSAYETVAASIGTGVGKDFTLHAAGEGTNLGQDVVFFAVPEPSGAVLIMVAGIGLMFRRRRRLD